MGNLFAMNFEKEGKGVPEAEQKENGFFRFFHIIRRKFWGMLRLNFLQVIGTLPAFIVSAFFISYFYQGLMPDDVEYDLAIRILFAFLMIATQLVTIGPIQAGFIYCMRNYAREEHVFIWSDFVKGIKENWKRAFAVGFIDFVVVSFLFYTYSFYNVNDEATGTLGFVFRVIIVVQLIIFIMMHFYLYPMMVTLDLTVQQLYGNALRFAIARFLSNIGVLLILVAFALLAFVNVLAALFIILLFGYALPNFLTTFYAYGAIDQYIIKKVEETAKH